MMQLCQHQAVERQHDALWSIETDIEASGEADGWVECKNIGEGEWI